VFLSNYLSLKSSLLSHTGCTGVPVVQCHVFMGFSKQGSNSMLEGFQQYLHLSTLDGW